MNLERRVQLGMSAVILAAFSVAGCDAEPAPQPAPTTVPATAPATTQPEVPTTRATEIPKPLTELIDVVRRNDPTFPTTRPLDEALEIPAAARLLMNEPVYLCSRGDLWITRDDAPSTEGVLKIAPKLQTHVVRERVQFVYWRPGTQPWSAELIAREGELDIWITSTARVELPAGVRRDWSRAILWNTDKIQSVVVPTADGLSIVTLVDGKIDERTVKLADAAPGVATYAVFDARGVLGWSSGPSVDSRVARFVDGAWTTFPPGEMWPSRLLHVVPFLDGTVLAIAQGDEVIQLKSVLLDEIPIDDAKVKELAVLLGNRLPEVRQKAQNDLSNLGPAAWPVLKRLSPTLPAEARIRIKAILGNESTPTLNGISPVPGPGRLVTRLPGGGVVLYFEAGVSQVDANGVVQRTAPAWLAVQPGQPVRALQSALVSDLKPSDARLRAWGDEWILEHDVDGPMRLLGNHLEPLVKRSERDFKRFVGIDAMARWVFKTIDPNGATLLIDPTLPDPRPKLPVWTLDTGRGAVGWDQNDWPVMKRGGAWILRDGAWATMKEADVAEKLKVSLDPPTTTQSSTLLTDAQGNVYGDGLQSLIVTQKDGSTITWPLPPEATGEGVIGGAAVLIEADGKLFLANAPGRLLRIKPQLDQPAEPFKLEAVFSRNIPAGDVRRIWKDPAGRIVIASKGSVLSVLFPSGRISHAMSNMIPAGQLRDALQEESDPPRER